MFIQQKIPWTIDIVRIIHFNSFDSGLLANKVGEVQLPNTEVQNILSFLRLAIVQASEEDYDLISVELPYQIKASEWLYVGGLLNFEGALDIASSRLERYVDRWSVHEMTDKEWHDLPRFLENHLAENRFTKDPNICRNAVIAQKMKIIDAYRVKSGVGYVALKEGSIVGFQFSYASDPRTAVLYEIEISPEYRNGFMALSLLGSSLAKLVEKERHLVYVSSSIYEDNLASLNLFRLLGLTLSPGRKFYYHFWPKHQRLI
jgi:ribosomal protein S18 acetylase RimI-like enzyme